MNSLNISNINIHSPYLVGFDGRALIFTTDSGIAYRVDFELDSNPYFTAIIQRTHPMLDEIVQRFDDEIQMFNDNKPDE